MEIIEILKKYNEGKLIKLIKNNKLHINLEELLIESVSVGENKLSNYLINEGVSFEYMVRPCRSNNLVGGNPT